MSKREKEKARAREAEIRREGKRTQTREYSREVVGSQRKRTRKKSELREKGASDTRGPDRCASHTRDNFSLRFADSVRT